MEDMATVLEAAPEDYVNNKDWASGFFYGGGNGADGFVYIEWD